MDTRVIVRNVALMAIFVAIGLTEFTENVRTVQIIGLMASGAVFGAALAMIVSAVRARRAKA